MQFRFKGQKRHQEAICFKTTSSRTGHPVRSIIFLCFYLTLASHQYPPRRPKPPPYSLRDPSCHLRPTPTPPKNDISIWGACKHSTTRDMHILPCSPLAPSLISVWEGSKYFCSRDGWWPKKDIRGIIFRDRTWNLESRSVSTHKRSLIQRVSRTTLDCYYSLIAAKHVGTNFSPLSSCHRLYFWHKWYSRASNDGNDVK